MMAFRKERVIYFNKMVGNIKKRKYFFCFLNKKIEI
jgi:hypothetical protein